MEIFRRLGIAKALREAGLPSNYPNDVAIRTTVTGIELARILIPSRSDRYSAVDGPDGWWPTPEPAHRVNQMHFEPILFAHAQSRPRIQVISAASVEDFVQHENEVVVSIRSADTDGTVQLSCRYLVGCDGGQSMVRKKIGAQLNGTPIIHQGRSICIRAPELLSLIPGAPAWYFQVQNPRRCGIVFAIDGRDTWLVRYYLGDKDTGLEAVNRDEAVRTILGVGADFHYEVIAEEDFVGRRLVADRFRHQRVFICGDAAHLWPPNGGYGMNAGIADAANLSWLLAAVLNGWAAPAILDAYEAERRPITEQVSQFAKDMASKNIEYRRETPAEIESPGPIGDATRVRVGMEAYNLNLQSICCGGLNFGYFYDDSPIIAYDGHRQPEYTMHEFTPSSIPGCRAPHIWLESDRSLYDALGPEYTLLRFQPAVKVVGLMESAARRGVPLRILDVGSSGARSLYGYDLVLVRPDQHVAWRGDGEPAAPMELIDLVRGARAMPRYS